LISWSLRSLGVFDDLLDVVLELGAFKRFAKAHRFAAA